MLNKYLKYLIIAGVNAGILTILLALWTDELELIFNDFVRPVEFLKIIGFTILSLVGIGITVFWFRKKNITSIKIKLIVSIFVTTLFSSYIYVDYTSKFIQNVIINRQLRNQIAQKIKSTSNVLANGIRAEHLTVREYQEIRKINWFPAIPEEASNISYIYEYDGLLPDYFFTLSYNLPKEAKVESINYTSGEFSKTQTFEIIRDKKIITYTEYQQ